MAVDRYMYSQIERLNCMYIFRIWEIFFSFQTEKCTHRSTKCSSLYSLGFWCLHFRFAKTTNTMPTLCNPDAFQLSENKSLFNWNTISKSTIVLFQTQINSSMNNVSSLTYMTDPLTKRFHSQLFTENYTICCFVWLLI